MALLRIVVSFLALLNLLLLAFDFWNWYAKDGLMPPALMDQELKFPAQRIFDGWPMQFDLPFQIPRLNLIPSSSPEWWTLTMYIITVISAALFMVGRWTRISGIVLALGMLSLHLRNIYIIHSGDSLLRLIVIYLVFSGAGAAYSLDHKIAMKKGLASATPKLVSVWPQRLVAVQISICYFITGWFKWLGNTWQNGTATWYPSQLHEFDRFPVPGFIERQPFIGITTYGTLLVELSMALLVWYKPWRKWILLGGLSLHAYIEYRFNIPFFALAITAGYIAYFDGHEVARWVDKRFARFKKAPAETAIEAQPASS